MAAEAVVEWIRARRATWSSEPLAHELGQAIALAGVAAEEPLSPSATLAAPPPAFNAPLPVYTDQPPVCADPLPPPDGPLGFDVAALLVAEPSVPEVSKPWVRLRFPTGTVRSFAAPFIRVARRAAPVAAVLALVVGAAWMAGPYVGKVKTWVARSTEKATAPKTEAVAAKPTPLRGTAPVGQLTARSEPPGAKVFVDGRERGVTPLTLVDVKIGSHTVVLQSEKGSVRRTVTVSSDRPVAVSESIFAGWLTVFAPFDLQITEGTRVVRLDENGNVLLPPGLHDLRLENRDLGYGETRQVEVQPGETTSLSLVVSPSTLSVTANAPAVVSIDGQPVGETPLTNQPIALGTRDIVVKGGDGTERRFTRRVTVEPVQIDVDFSQP